MGLEYITGKSLSDDDIDILIPKVFLSVYWYEFKTFLENKGYLLLEEHEHTFQKNDIFYSYASIEELEAFAGIKLSEIKLQKKDDIQFRLLSSEQYLKIYKTLAKDGYRVNIRKKKDNEKIAFIENQLKNKVLK